MDPRISDISGSFSIIIQLIAIFWKIIVQIVIAGEIKDIIAFKSNYWKINRSFVFCGLFKTYFKFFFYIDVSGVCSHEFQFECLVYSWQLEG